MVRVVFDLVYIVARSCAPFLGRGKGKGDKIPQMERNESRAVLKRNIVPMGRIFDAARELTTLPRYGVPLVPHCDSMQDI